MVGKRTAKVCVVVVVLFLVSILTVLDGVASSAADCKFEVDGLIYDISPLQNLTVSGNQTWKQPEGGNIYLQTFCSVLPEGCPSGDGITECVSCQTGSTPGSKSYCNGVTNQANATTLDPKLFNGTKGFMLQYLNGTKGCTPYQRSTWISLICDPNEANQGITDVMEMPTDKRPLGFGCVYLMNFSTPHVCNPYTSSGFGAGWVIVIIIIVAFVLYMLLGAVYNWRIKKSTGAQILPNLDFWKQFPYYVKDGFLFSYYKLTCKKGEYQPLPS